MRLLFSVIAFTLLSCSKQHSFVLKEDKYRVTIPKGTKLVSENFFADINETSNKEYKTYIEWLRKVYGTSSLHYKSALIDSSVFAKSYEPKYGEPHIALSEYYFKHPGFDDYPIVGINLAQAQGYCNWKSEVLTKEILTAKGLISEFIDSDTRHFSIESYLKGEADWINARKEVPIVKFKIPSSSEWEELAGINTQFRLGVNLKDTLKWKNRRAYAFITRDKLEDTISFGHFEESNLQAPVGSAMPNVYGLYNSIGNVSELVSDTGISKGGNFKMFSDNINIDGQNEFFEPNYWTGFRCVCSYEITKINGS